MEGKSGKLQNKIAMPQLPLEVYTASMDNLILVQIYSYTLQNYSSIDIIMMKINCSAS